MERLKGFLAIFIILAIHSVFNGKFTSSGLMESVEKGRAKLGIVKISNDKR